MTRHGGPRYLLAMRLSRLFPLVLTLGVFACTKKDSAAPTTPPTDATATATDSQRRSAFSGRMRRRFVLNFDQASSIGLKSGEYGGR